MKYNPWKYLVLRRPCKYFWFLDDAPNWCYKTELIMLICDRLDVTYVFLSNQLRKVHTNTKQVKTSWINHGLLPIPSIDLIENVLKLHK